MKTICVASARPNFMKLAPIFDAFRPRPEFEPLLVHTGQHYDDAMSGVFFRELGLPKPFRNLGVGSGSSVARVAETMARFERVCLEEKPNLILVVGDVDGTLAAALVAAKLRIPLAHVEAGLRSFDRSMPEEINRVVVDSLADFLFCSEESAVRNLRREGAAPDKIFFVGNVMIDSLYKNLAAAAKSDILSRLDLRPRSYAVVTLHRPSNVDDPDALREILGALVEISRDLPLVFPVHPRTRKNIDALGLRPLLNSAPNIRLLEPLGRFDFLALVKDAGRVFTDSGGIQEETTALRVPCVTIRDNTERPITVEIGSNQLAGRSASGILAANERVARGEFDDRAIPPLWDGRAAERIVDALADRFQLERRRPDGNRSTR